MNLRPPPPALLTVAEVAALMRVSKNKVYALIAAGELAPTDIGEGRAKTRIDEDEYARFRKAHTRKTA